MPYVKPISGHTKLGAAQRYLERERRAFARDFLNLDAPMEGVKAGTRRSGRPMKKPYAS